MLSVLTTELEPSTQTATPSTLDQALVDAAAAELAAEAAATQYQRNRQPEYPSLATLADALYWSNQGDNTKLDEYYAACAAVKAKYPKP
jgi:streptomycin 6-kinase